MRRVTHQRPAQPNRSRSGTSLVETVVMIGVSMIMLGLAVTMIHLLLRAERFTTQAVWHNTTLARVSRLLRDDVHAALTADVQPPADDRPAALTLQLTDDRIVSYQIEEHQLTRTETAGDATTRRDAFYLPPGSTLSFQRVDGPPAIVRLSIRRAPVSTRAAAEHSAVSGESPMRRVFVIEAIVGRIHRFEETN
jgi:hypothetical protein